jgi:glycosyltransferase involved in cell wall biosynthesis
MEIFPWVSFCISTYKRPAILQKQLILLSQQTFRDFEVIVSDNDPDASAKNIVLGMSDQRFKYFHNIENIGMIKSFNKSIERATADFVVMVTDDDPIDTDFLDFFYKLYLKYPSYSVYCGFNRRKKNYEEVEIIDPRYFLREILDPDKTYNHLWSSAVIRKSDAINVGLIPDYGSPHLADHALITLAGSTKGGVIVNRLFSNLSSHDTNFSKFNFDNYVIACKGFYEFMMAAYVKSKSHSQQADKNILIKHLGTWFIGNFFLLTKYYTFKKKDVTMLAKLKTCSQQILSLDFMKKFRTIFLVKSYIFSIKKSLRLLP